MPQGTRTHARDGRGPGGWRREAWRRWRPATALALGCALALTACAGAAPVRQPDELPAAVDDDVVSPGADGPGTAQSPSAPDPTPGPTTTPGATRTPSPTEDPATEPTEPGSPEPEPTEPAPTAPAPQEPSPTAPDATPEEPAEPEPLVYGDEGPEVLALQERLTELGYFLPAADGDFGPATQQAVWALQKAAGLTRDGLVGPNTLAALEAGTRPTPRTTSGRVIEVDLARQLLLAVDDGVVTRVVNASSGNGETYTALGRRQRAVTPTGDWTIVREVDGVRESSLELGSMYRPKYFHKGWAVHGSPSIPPWPASHGCVRVSNAAMNWIWDVWGVPKGTRVLVY
ncbi:murein L,D-transpeptidase [Cellulomonas sp. APG4]|uniref:L,D-transpeptidase family protein n=1 Tax=Cellulomonas sp. APG4 TaxID=1538656 RepID=UPI00137A0D7E|nr:L,D-transpeptidase family protein [Cellulomonas sp. APG4]NCT89455.1 murein L,D-transpeptidase [Cellulomonas sp. APG4]